MDDKLVEEFLAAEDFDPYLPAKHLPAGSYSFGNVFVRHFADNQFTGVRVFEVLDMTVPAAPHRLGWIDATILTKPAGNVSHKRLSAAVDKLLAERRVAA